MANQLELDTLNQSAAIVAGTPYVPTRKLQSTLTIAPPGVLQNQIAALSAVNPPTTPIGANTLSAAGGGAPAQLISVAATEDPVSAQNTTQSQVAVTFVRNGADTNYAATRIWFTGYKGSKTPQLMTQGTDSPILFVVDSTGETVVITAQPIGSGGTSASFAGSKTCTVTLDGVLSPPPAPSIAQSLLGTATGYQFSFNQLPAQLDDVIDGYQIYRNTTGILDGTQTKIQYIKHNPTNSAAIVVTDLVVPALGVFYYYWVSAVDTAKLESTLTAAQSGTVFGSIGSIPPTAGTPFKSTTTSTSVTWTTSPSAFFTRSDGTRTLVGQTVTAVTGLSAGNTTYYLPYWRESDQTLQWVSPADVTIPTIVGARFAASSSQWVQTSTSASIPSTFSVEIWFMGSTAANQALFSYSNVQGTGAASSAEMQAFVTTAGNVEFSIWNGSAWKTVVTSGATVLDGSWHHIVCTYDPSASSGTIAVWVDSDNTSDGVTFWSTSSVGTIVTTAGFWHIGFIAAFSGSPATVNTFNTAMLSHAAIYTSALNSAQVGAHFQAFVNTSETLYAAEVAYDSATNYWKLTETAGTTAADSIGTNTGTYEGSPTLNQSSPIVTVQGTPQIAWPYVTITALQAQSFRNRVALSIGGMSATSTVGSGSGGGSGGGFHGGGGCFTGDTLVKTSLGPIPIKEIRPGHKVLTAKGTWCAVHGIVTHGAEQRTLHVLPDGALVTHAHKILVNSEWVCSGDVYSETREANEPVYTLSIFSRETEDTGVSPQTEHSFTLENGVIASNVLPK